MVQTAQELNVAKKVSMAEDGADSEDSKSLIAQS